jgi:DNA polymerase I-like protein with 3'-5' exonuclease and polymerase domains
VSFLTFTQINQLAKKYFKGPRYAQFCKRFFDLIIERSTDKEITDRFTDVPIEIIAPYAIADAEYTSQIRRSLEEETKKLGIVRVSEIYNDLGKLGFEMESAGIAWDDG